MTHKLIFICFYKNKTYFFVCMFKQDWGQPLPSSPRKNQEISLPFCYYYICFKFYLSFFKFKNPYLFIKRQVK